MSTPLRRAVQAALFLFCSVSVAFSVCGEVFPPAGLDTYIEKGIKDWRLPGLAIAVVRDDQVIFEKGYGVRELGKDERVDKNTVFAIGSTSKAFTCLAVGLLVQDGRISWDDPVIRHMPGFQLYDPWVTREITVRDLLCNRTDLRPESELLWYATDYDRDEVVRRLRHVKLESSFRAKYAYRNTMFLTAGQLIPVVTGKSWDDFLAQRVFKPLGMTRTFTSTKALQGLGNVASPHLEMAGRLVAVPYRKMDNIAPAGAIISCVKDLAQWLRLHMNNGIHDGVRIVESDVIRETHTQHTPVWITDAIRQRFPSAQRIEYCMGWVTFDHAGNLVVWHNGEIDGMHAVIGFIPEKKVGAVVLSNSESQTFHEALFMHVMDLLLGNEPRDWSKLYLQNWKKSREAKAKSLKEIEEARIPGTHPTLPLDAYAGAYENDIYGEVRIEREENGLVLHFSSALIADLEHWNYDTFRGTWRDKVADVRMGKSLLVFGLDAKGDVVKMAMGEWFTFQRIQKSPEGQEKAAEKK